MFRANPLDMDKNGRYQLVERALISGIAEIKFGAHPTSAAPDYHLDLAHIKQYVESANTEGGWAEYRAQFVDVDEAAYLKAIGGADRVSGLSKPPAH